MKDDRQIVPDASGLRIGVALSRYHLDITDALRDGAVSAFTDAGGAPDDLTIVEAPGAFELAVIGAALANQPDIDGVVALGCIIRGETTHDAVLAGALADSLADIAVRTGKPVSFGVLTCQTMHQARERAGGDKGDKGNKGAEAMTAAIETVRAMRSIGRDAAQAKPGAVESASGMARP